METIDKTQLILITMAMAFCTEANKIDNIAPMVLQLQIVIFFYYTVPVCISYLQLFPDPWHIGDAQNIVVFEASK